MNQLNSSDESAEDPKNQPKKSRRNIVGLANDAVERLFTGDEDQSAIYEKLTSEEGIDMLRAKMQTIWASASDEYAVTQEEIDKLSPRTIETIVLEYGLSIRNARESLEATILAQFGPEVFGDKKKTNEQKNNYLLLQEGIRNANYRDLYLMRKNPRLRKHFLKRIYGDKLDTFPERDVSTILSDVLGVPWTNLNPAEQEVFRRLAVNKIHNGFVATTDVEKMLDIIERGIGGAVSPEKRIEKKRNLICFFLPTVNLDYLVQSGIYSPKELRTILQAELIKESRNPQFFESTDAKTRSYREDLLDVLIVRSKQYEIQTKNLFEIGTEIANKLTHPDNRKPLVDAIVSEFQHYEDATAASTTLPIRADKDGNFSASFIAFLISHASRNGGKDFLTNAEKLSENAVLRFRKSDGNQAFLQVTRIDDKNDQTGKMGVTLTDASVNGKYIASGGESLFLSWDDFYGMMNKPNILEAEVIPEKELEARKSLDESNPAYIEPYSITIDSLERESDLKLVEGHAYRIRNVAGIPAVVRLVEINGRELRFMGPDGMREGVSYENFGEVARSSRMEHIGDIHNGESFANFMRETGIQGQYGPETIGGIYYEGGKLLIEGEKYQKTEICYFVNKDGNALQIESYGPDNVRFKEFEGFDHKNLHEYKIKGVADSMTYEGLYQYLRESEMKPQLIPKETKTEDVESEDIHLHGSAVERYFQYMSIKDIGGSFEMLKHAIEHKLEKGSRVNSAKFANKYFSGFLPEGFKYQLRSEAYSGMSETMEQVLKLLKDQMSGKEARLYVMRKIMTNKNARFEEVMAGLFYVAETAGILYPEELSELQNSRIWFKQLCRTANPPQDLNLWWGVVEKKLIEDYKFTPGAITETERVELLLKMWEGTEGSNKYPKVFIPPRIGSRFPMLVSQGIEENKKKGEEEVQTRGNITAKNSYAKTKYRVAEFDKTVGCIENIIGKNGSAMEITTMPFMLVMGPAIETGGQRFGQDKLHKLGLSQQYSLHPFAFGHNLGLAKLYRNMVGQITNDLHKSGKLPADAVTDLAAIETKRKDLHNHDDRQDRTLTEFSEMLFAFWQKYGGKLHPYLQMTNPWIEMQARERGGIYKDYAERYKVYLTMQDRPDDLNKDMWTQDNMAWESHSPPPFKNLVNFAVNAIDGMSKIMRIKEYEKVWKLGVLGAFRGIKNLPDTYPEADREKILAIQREKYIEYYKLTMIALQNKLMGQGFQDTERANYIGDLRAFGFDLDADDFLGTAIEREERNERKAGESFNRFIRGASVSSQGLREKGESGLEMMELMDRIKKATTPRSGGEDTRGSIYQKQDVPAGIPSKEEVAELVNQDPALD